MKISNEKEFSQADTRYNLTKIASDEILISDVDDIWDGPLSGTCTWKGDNYYFFTFDQVVDGEDKWPRTYVLIKPATAHTEALTLLRDAYQKRQQQLISSEEYQKIYDNFPPQRIDSSQLIGWFDDGGKSSKFIESYFKWQSTILPI
jgi:hypothetical protein